MSSQSTSNEAAVASAPTSALAPPLLLVLPAQPQGASVQFAGPDVVFNPPPAPTSRKTLLPNKSNKPCACCKVPQCGGLRKRYTPPKCKTEGSKQKIFTYCPTTGKSTTAGFDAVYESSEMLRATRALEEFNYKRR